MFFPPFVYNIFSVNLSFQQFEYNVSSFNFFFCFLSPSWHSPSFLQLYFGVFHHFWKILNHYIFKHFFCLILSLFFWDSNYTRMRPHDFCHISCALCCCWVPLPLFLTFWASMCIICIYLSSSSFFFSLACVTSDASVDILVFCYHVFLFYNFHLTLSYSFCICWLSLFVHSCSSSFPL